VGGWTIGETGPPKSGAIRLLMVALCGKPEREGREELRAVATPVEGLPVLRPERWSEAWATDVGDSTGAGEPSAVAAWKPNCEPLVTVCNTGCGAPWSGRSAIVGMLSIPPGTFFYNSVSIALQINSLHTADCFRCCFGFGAMSFSGRSSATCSSCFLERLAFGLLSSGRICFSRFSICAMTPPFPWLVRFRWPVSVVHVISSYKSTNKIPMPFSGAAIAFVAMMVACIVAELNVTLCASTIALYACARVDEQVTLLPEGK
jgi:hypothetical protein